MAYGAEIQSVVLSGMDNYASWCWLWSIMVEGNQWRIMVDWWKWLIMVDWNSLIDGKSCLMKNENRCSNYDGESKSNRKLWLMKVTGPMVNNHPGATVIRCQLHKTSPNFSRPSCRSSRCWRDWTWASSLQQEGPTFGDRHRGDPIGTAIVIHGGHRHIHPGPPFFWANIEENTEIHRRIADMSWDTLDAPPWNEA